MAFDKDHEIDVKIKSFSKANQTSFYYIWHEGLPNFARASVWPILIENQLKINKSFFSALRQQFEN